MAGIHEEDRLLTVAEVAERLNVGLSLAEAGFSLTGEAGQGEPLECHRGGGVAPYAP